MSFAIGAVCCIAAMLALLPLARRLGWYDHPDDGRKDHAVPTPFVGGIAVAAGALAAVLLLGLDGGDLRAIAALGAAGLLMLATGLFDDLHDSNWRWRIAAQVLASLILIHGGGLAVNHVGTVFGHPITSLGWFSIPFTVFMVVALINALNMADGVDGLTGSVVLVGLAMFAAAALYAGDPALFSVLAAVAGAVLGFLVFNLRRPGLPRARVFLGNGGSALLGLVIAWASLRLTQNPEHPVTAILLPWLLVPPVVDAVALVLRRAAQGRSPFAADRNHMHHFMLDAGFSPSQIALSLGGISLGLGGLAALALRNNWLEHTALVLIYVAMTIAWFLLTWRRERAVAFFAVIHQRRRSPVVPQLAKPDPPAAQSRQPDRGPGRARG
jgi:UDP-GlcNAc:undecaprenyl-phosphate GlcNAc-1-phosphate transferase